MKHSWLLGIGSGLALVFIAAAATPSVAEKRSTPSFVQTHQAFQRLSKQPAAPREQWLGVIRSFHAIYVSDPFGQRGRRGLFLAGRSCLSLYRTSGKPEDLDEAIKHLNEFVRVHRKGPYLILGLQELKEADILRRRLSEKPPENTVEARGTAKHEGPTPPVEPAVIPRPEPSVTSEIAQVSDPPAGTRPRSSRPRSGGALPGHYLQGNPFFSRPEASATPDALRMKSAALPPTTMTDALPAPRTSRQVPKGSSRSYVVVIDPGHGGKDPGAVSPDATLQEKDVTLQVAQRVKSKLLEQLPTATVELTRSDDRFLGLEERTAFANSLNADLFLSIHCNGHPDPTSKGIETYYLSKACSRKAMASAARENGIPFSKMSDVDNTLLDLMIESKKNESIKMANVVHESLISRLARTTAKGRDRGVRRGPFYVLLGAKMPAVLVECGFINNSREKERLQNSTYLDTLADGIAKGITTYVRGQENRWD